MSVATKEVLAGLISMQLLNVMDLIAQAGTYLEMTGDGPFPTTLEPLRAMFAEQWLQA